MAQKDWLDVTRPVSFEKMHDAARIIAEDGTEGFHSAAEIVGGAVAMGMLVTYLRREMNPKPHVFPEPDDLKTRVDEVLKKNFRSLADGW